MLDNVDKIRVRFEMSEARIKHVTKGTKIHVYSKYDKKPSYYLVKIHNKYSIICYFLSVTKIPLIIIKIIPIITIKDGNKSPKNIPSAIEKIIFV